ncbi:MAG: TonB-dependent receptor [Proteobacteria bacterium]|nr:TonB-dependent receptor [Pseudomonadota bacterium]
MRLRLIRCLAILGAVALLQCLLPAIARAANTGEDNSNEGLTEVVVTGTRLVLPNMASVSPIEVVTAKEIAVSGKNDITDVIMQLPQNFNNSFADFNNRTSALTTAGGIATADLRGLGPVRTLVLVNGRRLGVGDANTANPNPAPDLDQIPTALIERVDVVTGGASATYGSDAIAGVINFVMRRDFAGVELSGQLGSDWHNQHSETARALLLDGGHEPPSGVIHDGKNRSLNLVLGSNIADGKGNVTAFLGYLRADPVPSGNRDFGACQLNAAPDPTGTFYNGAFCSGSGNSNSFRVLGGGTTYSVSGNQFVPRGSVATTPPAIFNSQPYIYNGRDDTRYTAGFLAHVDLNELVKPYAEFGFMNDKTDQKIAPSGLFGGANPLDPLGTGSYPVNCDNPLLSPQQAAVLCSPAQLTYVAANPGQPCTFANGSSPNCADVGIGRRNIEGGGRESLYEHTNFRGVVGLTGSLGEAWRYDAYGQYYYTSFFNINKQYMNFANIDSALQVTGTRTNPVCISGPPCVPYNIFADGGVTQAALDYLYLNGSAYGTNTQRIAHLDLTGDLGQYHVRSPWAADGFAVNLGYEHRREQLAFDPDSGEVGGLLSGFGGAAAPIHAGYSVNEGFVELGGPIVQDAPGISNLTAAVGYRYSSYSISGAVNTGKFSVQYAPIPDLRLRASFQRAIRAPNLIELFNPVSVNLIGSGDDPCAPNEFSGVVAATLEQCLRTLPANATPAEIQAFTNLYRDPATGRNLITQGTGSQLNQLQGGNPGLKPEQANTFNIGVTLAPGLIPNLTGSLDYYHISLKDQIGAIPPGLLLQECLNTGARRFCDGVIRNPVDGSLATGSVVGQAGYIAQTAINVGASRLSGIDAQLGYQLPVGGWGKLSWALNGAYLLESEAQPFTGGPTYDCAGLFGAVCQTVNPRWRHNLRTTWSTPWNVEIFATWRFISAVALDNNDANPLLYGHSFLNQNTGGPTYNTFEGRLPSFSYLDLSAAWTFMKGIEVRAGINNLLDKDPPLVTSEITASGANNTFETYDTLGRQLFLAFTARF